jgi:hypothetical protein
MITRLHQLGRSPVNSGGVPLLNAIDSEHRPRSPCRPSNSLIASRFIGSLRNTFSLRILRFTPDSPDVDCHEKSFRLRLSLFRRRRVSFGLAFNFGVNFGADHDDDRRNPKPRHEADGSA